MEIRYIEYRDAIRATRWKTSMYWFRERVSKVLYRRKERDTSRSKWMRQDRNSVYYARYDRWCVFLQRKWYSSYFFLVACWIQTTKDLYRTKVVYLTRMEVCLFPFYVFSKIGKIQTQNIFFPKWRRCMLLELGVVFYHYVFFAKLEPFPIFGRTTKVAIECQREI